MSALPTEEELRQIFVVQLKLANITVHPAFPAKLAKRFIGISGRTSKQLVRLASMWAQSHGINALDLSSFEAVARFQRLDRDQFAHA